MPFPNEHSSRLRDPGEFKEKPDWSSEGKFRRVSDGTIFNRIKVPQTADVIWGQLKSQSGRSAAPQAIRFPTEDWTEKQARDWLKENKVKFILFEPASQSTDSDNATADTREYITELAANKLWMIRAEHLEHFLSSIMSKTRPPRNKVWTPEEDMYDGYGYDRRGSVAIVKFHGMHEKRYSRIGHVFGVLSTEMVQRDIQNALNDPEVDSIILDIDSPGGTVDGTKELSDFIYEARGNKPIIAHASGLMCSGAYYIGSACDEVYATDTTRVGSIGVYTMHIDASKFYEDFGLKISLIYAGKEKVTGHPFAPLSDDDREILQKEVDGHYDKFVETVARNRNVEEKTVRKDMAEGRVFLGEEAKQRGLIDGIAKNSEILAGLNNAKLFVTNKPKTSTKELFMSLFTGDGKQPLNAELLEKEAPDIYQAIFDKGKESAQAENKTALDTAVADAKKSEKENAVKILGIVEKNPSLASKAKEEYGKEGADVGQIAITLLQEKGTQDKNGQEVKDFEAGAAPGSPGTGDDDQKPDAKRHEERWSSDEKLRKVYQKAGGHDAFIAHAQRWDKDPKIQNEFADDFDAFLAFSRAGGK